MTRESAYRFVRYFLSGGTATIVNFGTLYLLTEFAGVWYIASSIIATSFGFLTSFVLQKFWTFQNRRIDIVHVQFSLHIALSLANIALNVIALYILVEYAHLWYMLAQFFIAGALACINYVVYLKIIFPHVEARV